MQSVKTVCDTRITWERYHNKKIIAQCHCCQMWNHATSNCNAKPVCMKYAENHWTYSCTKPNNTAAKCANCKGDQPANSITCPVYVQKLEMITQQRNTKKNLRNGTFSRRRTRRPKPGRGQGTVRGCHEPCNI